MTLGYPCCGSLKTGVHKPDCYIVTGMRFTNEEKAAAAKREVTMRRRVYAGQVSAGKMSPNDARRGIAIMEAIAADYEALAADERLI